MKRYKLLAWLFFLTVTAISQPATFTSRGVGGGGALFSPSVNPADHSEFYISCDMSELFHSGDFGESYTQVHFSQFTGGPVSKVNFTTTTGLLFSLSYFNDIPTPVRSTDNGVTWSVLPGNPDNSETCYSFSVDYHQPERMVLSHYNQLFFSSNGGNSFTLIHNAANSGSGIVVGGVFYDEDHIYIGTNDGLLVSDNGGSTWTIALVPGIPAAQGIWSFTGAKQGGVTRFFCITGNKSDIYAGMPGSDYWDFFKGLYSYDVESSGWIARQEGITSGVDFPMFIDMAENDIQRVYIAGSNNLGEPVVMKSTNAGTAWAHVFLAAGNSNITTGWSGSGGDRGWSYGECPFGFEVAANNADVLLFTDYGFCHTSADGGASWSQAYVSKTSENPAGSNTPQKKSYNSIGLENTSSWQLHWSDANTMWACFSDIRGIRSTDAGKTWSFNYTGHIANTSYRVVQTVAGTLVAATSGVHDMYQSTRLMDNILDASDANGKLIYSHDNGLTWQNLHVFNHPVFWIALDPGNPERAYASVIHYDGGNGVGGVYRCDNLSALSSSTWTLLPDPPGTEKHPASLNVLADGTLVASYSGRRTSSGFTPSSGVFTYNPASGTWTDVSHAGMRYWTKDVVIDPNDPAQNTWYVGVFSGWGGNPNGLGGLYKTINRGASWQKLTGSLLDRVTSCTFNPENPDELYITTEGQGLWVSQNINDASPTFSQVSSYPFRQPERIFFNPYDINEMWVTSFGNGLKLGLIDDTSLPVSLAYFQSQVLEEKIWLQWETTSETGSDRFELERSTDPRHGFQTIARIPAGGDTAGSYSYADTNALPEISYYYRLKQLDQDNNYTYSKIVRVRLSSDSTFVVYPNPASDEIMIRSKEPILSAEIVDARGQTVVRKEYADSRESKIPVSGLAPGLYTVKLVTGTGTVMRKVWLY